MSDILGVRTNINWCTPTPVVANAVEQLIVLAGTRQSLSVASTSTLMTPAGRTMRIERVSFGYLATGTSGWATLRLRVKPNGAVSVSDPIAIQLESGAPTPASPNSTCGHEVGLCDGLEIPAGFGWGITLQGYSGITPTTVGLVVVEASGFEYQA